MSTYILVPINRYIQMCFFTLIINTFVHNIVYRYISNPLRYVKVYYLFLVHCCKKYHIELIKGNYKCYILIFCRLYLLERSFKIKCRVSIIVFARK